ncbi:MAG: class I SAM-dependent methyltransferase, partial [Pedosphaera sp.]|nr:class I SAM-dependent methyltransferase [Pedosphaera sp.]
METKPALKNVHAFWNTEACGTYFVQQFEDEKDFFEKFRENRYRTEWHIPLLMPFAQAKGKSVLKIGTGNGADGAVFALEGAHYTGVDLTDAALEATRKHFQVFGLPGTFQHENAEQLSFPDASFDLVYSHGVLHHTPNTQRAIDEVWRVLKPGSQAIIMLYYKRSFNYFVRILTYMRLRVLLKILLRAGRWSADRRRLAADEILGVRGNTDRQVWEIHYGNFLKAGWSYLQARNFVHHCTDGPECPVAFAFNQAEARRLFARFAEVQIKVAHFPIRKYSSGQWVPFGVEKLLASTLGWYLFIFATKP